MLRDIEIAQQTKMDFIEDVAKRAGLHREEIELYGDYKAKINDKAFSRLINKKDGKLILVTAINPTPAGEGKTTTTVGLGQAMKKIGKNCVIALREPSLGPVFGVKGGATGGGYSQVVPMEDINLHFTGDIHAVSVANNLLCALIDNHIQQGNEQNIDPRRITFKRVLDMNDRSLRNIVIGLGGKPDGVPREDNFMITVASEVMAVLCLAEDLEDLKRRLSNILIGYRYDGSPVFCRDLHAQGSLTVLLKDAIKPNLVQTLDKTPCLMHGGPFANIAHGCNSIKATKLAMKLGDYCITEAGFGSDLGAEKFFDITCRKGDFKPDAAVLVATVRALRYNGGVKKEDLKESNVEAVHKGAENLRAHIKNLKGFGVNVVVALNHFEGDSESEIAIISKICADEEVPYALSEVFSKGADGGVELAKLVVAEAQKGHSSFNYIYDDEDTIEQKIEKVVTKVYGGIGVSYDLEAKKQIAQIKEMGFSQLPICIAKTQYSLSDNPSLLGRPHNFTINVRNVRLCSGAGFIVILTGDIMTMPGLPKKPAAVSIDIDKDGIITGLF